MRAWSSGVTVRVCGTLGRGPSSWRGCMCKIRHGLTSDGRCSNQQSRISAQGRKENTLGTLSHAVTHGSSLSGLRSGCISLARTAHRAGHTAHRAPNDQAGVANGHSARTHASHAAMCSKNAHARAPTRRPHDARYVARRPMGRSTNINPDGGPDGAAPLPLPPPPLPSPPLPPPPHAPPPRRDTRRGLTPWAHST